MVRAFEVEPELDDKEADRIYSYTGDGERPTVSVTILSGRI